MEYVLRWLFICLHARYAQQQSITLLPFSLMFALFYDGSAPNFDHISYLRTFSIFFFCWQCIIIICIILFYLLDDFIAKWHKRIIYDVIIEILQFLHSIHSISMSFELVHYIDAKYIVVFSSHLLGFRSYIYCQFSKMRFHFHDHYIT